MKTKSLIFSTLTFFLIIINGCKGPAKNATIAADEPTAIVYNNPPAEGFDIEGSNPIAILIADQIMNAMGGRATWDNTNVLFWNFFGKRTLLWDKQGNRVRVDMPDQNKVVTLDMNDNSGRVWLDGEEVSAEEEIKKNLDMAKSIWINDSYWLVMPFKLKDSGVTLSYLRDEPTMKGARADVLGMTFENVGDTPQNAYEIWVDVDSKLIMQWAYFKDANDDEPAFVLPWDDYNDYGGLLLSGERGERDITNIKVLDKAPKGSFDDPSPIKFPKEK
ncbi:MAG: hypothetical protein ABJ004_04845 [Cyclobacteriaceae bacterium]